MKTALLKGGASPEREISLQSGAQIESALRHLGADFIAVDPGVDARWLTTLQDAGARRVFNILHGGAGENGGVRGALNAVGIACSGSDVLGSALAMNKHVSKQVWRAAGVPTPDWRLAFSPDDAAEILRALPPPLFVKPACGGSSTNSAVVADAGALPAAIARAAAEGGGALAERRIIGEEYTLSVVNDKPLPLIHIAADGAFYDYRAKYVSDNTRLICPCGLPAEKERAITDAGMRAFRALHCAHWGRVDLMVDAGGQPYFLEVNTVPGMTSHSLVPCAARAAGMDFNALIAALLATIGGEGAAA